MGCVGTDIHQVGNTLAAVSLGLFLEPFSQLEEKHDKHSFGELRLGTRHKADSQCA